MKKSQVDTLGCRINTYESEVIKQIIKDYPNYIVINTCTVTGEAHRQSLQRVRKIRREQPDAKVIVTGCAATTSPQDFVDIADVVIANNMKLCPSSYIEGAEVKPSLITGFEGRNRAFIQVQQGCDFKCTYCIVPSARGKSCSIPYSEIKKQIEDLHKNGAKEIVLTGINLSDYDGGIANLTNQIFNDFETIRLRYGSLDPASIDGDIINMFKDERLLPHIHLSIQSGDNLVLKQMGRRHTREQVIEASEKLHKIRPEIMLGADFITGFPTETDEQFNNTLKLIDEANIAMLHVFPYSERPGTPAAKMPQIDKNIRKQRAETLRGVGVNLLNKKLHERIGKTIPVLFETDEKGHSHEYIMVHAAGVKDEILNVTITRIENNELIGHVV